MNTEQIEAHVALARQRVKLLRELAALEDEEAALRAKVKAMPPSATSSRIERVKCAVAEALGARLAHLELAHGYPGAKCEEFAWPRLVAMALCYELADVSARAVGARFGGRDHGAVLYAVKAMANRCATCQVSAEQVEGARIAAREALEGKFTAEKK